MTLKLSVVLSVNGHAAEVGSLLFTESEFQVCLLKENNLKYWFSNGIILLNVQYMQCFDSKVRVILFQQQLAIAFTEMALEAVPAPFAFVCLIAI